jgi:hypothetical protein
MHSLKTLCTSIVSNSWLFNPEDDPKIQLKVCGSNFGYGTATVTEGFHGSP